MRGRTYAIQVGLDVTIGVDGGLLAAQLVNAADDGNVSPNVAIEEGRSNAWGRGGVHVFWREGGREGGFIVGENEGAVGA